MTLSKPSMISRRALLAGTAAAAIAGPARSESKAPMLAPTPAFSRFKLGAFELTVVSDGPLHMGPPQDGVFSDTTKEQMAKILADNSLPTDNVSLEQNILVVDTGKRRILFDTGLGSFKMMGPDTGRLLTYLSLANIDPKQIDAVVLTHAHPDHCFALMTDDGARNFPNAQVYLTQADLEFWTDEAKAAHPQIGALVQGARKHLLPNRERMQFVKDGQELLPGIVAMATPGHTIGHMSYIITSQGRTLCNVGDVVHHHVMSVQTPRKQFMYDTDGKQAVTSRVRLLDMLASQNVPMLGYHFQWPGIGRVARSADSYRYTPVLPSMQL